MGPPGIQRNVSLVYSDLGCSVHAANLITTNSQYSTIGWSESINANQVSEHSATCILYVVIPSLLVDIGYM